MERSKDFKKTFLAPLGFLGTKLGSHFLYKKTSQLMITTSSRGGPPLNHCLVVTQRSFPNGVGKSMWFSGRNKRNSIYVCVPILFAFDFDFDVLLICATT